MEKPLRGYLTAGKIERIAGILLGEGIAVLPTDTVYGFHCIIKSRESIEHIRAIKGKGKISGFIMLVSSISMANRYVSHWPYCSKELLSGLWPAPVTAILPAGKRVPACLKPGGTVAVRMPRHKKLTFLINRIGYPVVSTSVNHTGREPMRRIAEIKRIFPGLDAYISRKGRCPAFPSAVVDFTQKRPSLVRKGAMPPELHRIFTEEQD
jgi:tRNA threonylcarbamoyl adenosine modification protein (Sua5/YciO/YrdC/YwlC family)